MRAIETVSSARRPIRSPIRPSTTLPTGRAANPIANTANAIGGAIAAVVAVLSLEPEPDAVVEPDSAADPEPDADPDSAADPDPDPDSAPDAVAEPDAGAEPVAGAVAAFVVAPAVGSALPR